MSSRPTAIVTMLVLRAGPRIGVAGDYLSPQQKGRPSCGPENFMRAENVILGEPTTAHQIAFEHWGDGQVEAQRMARECQPGVRHLGEGERTNVGDSMQTPPQRER